MSVVAVFWSVAMQRWHPCDLLSYNMCNTLVFTLYWYMQCREKQSQMQSFYVNGGANDTSHWTVGQTESYARCFLHTHSDWIHSATLCQDVYFRRLPDDAINGSLSAKTKRNSFGAVDLVQSNPPHPPFLCLPLSKARTLCMNEEDSVHTHLKKSSQKYQRGGKKRLLCSFPLPLSLFPTLPKVLLGNRSQVFDKPVVDMTAVQSSV